MQRIEHETKPNLIQFLLVLPNEPLAKQLRSSLREVRGLQLAEGDIIEVSLPIDNREIDGFAFQGMTTGKIAESLTSFLARRQEEIGEFDYVLARRPEWSTLTDLQQGKF